MRWTVDELHALDRDYYAVLVDELNKDAERQETET
jgi:hypothetical protein